MSIDELKKDAFAMTAWQRHRFLGLVAGVICLALVLVVVALQLYNTSGAAQLDLSRPGYQDVRKRAIHNDNTMSFSSSGPVDQSTVDQFTKLYDERAKNVLSVDSFDEAALSDDSLRVFNNPDTTPQ